MAEQEKKQPMKLTAEQREALTARRSEPWRTSIVKYLADHGPATDIEIYDATRPDNRDTLTEQQKKHNVASQMTYLKDDGYVIISAEGKRVVIADPKDNVYPGAEKYLS